MSVKRLKTLIALPLLMLVVFLYQVPVDAQTVDDNVGRRSISKSQIQQHTYISQPVEFKTSTAMSESKTSILNLRLNLLNSSGSSKETKPSTQQVPSKVTVPTNIAELKQIVYPQIRQLKTEFTVPYAGNTSNLSADIKQMMKDIVWEEPYAGGAVDAWEVRSKKQGGTLQLTYYITYLSTPQKEKVVDAEVKKIAKQIFTAGMSDFQKVKAVNDYIVLNTEYSYNTKGSPYMVHTLLTEGKAVCQAYALLAYRLLQEIGMDVYYVTGMAGGEYHAWNMVKVDGKWYHLDTTWNDPVFKDGDRRKGSYIRYKYFLVPDSVISKDHQISSHGFPKATDDRFAAMRAVETPVQVGNEIYFPNIEDNIRLYKINLNASKPTLQKVSNTRVQSLVYHNGWLYYSNYSNGGYLYKMKPNGSQETLIAKEFVDTIKIEGNQLVYRNNSNKQFKIALSK